MSLIHHKESRRCIRYAGGFISIYGQLWATRFKIAQAKYPPSTVTVVPVVYEDASDTKYNTVPAISSG